jgi:hypothetical protein
MRHSGLSLSQTGRIFRVPLVDFGLAAATPPALLARVGWMMVMRNGSRGSCAPCFACFARACIYFITIGPRLILSRVQSASQFSLGAEKQRRRRWTGPSGGRPAPRRR